MVDEGRKLTREGDALMGGPLMGVCGWSCVYLVGTCGWGKFVELWVGGRWEGWRRGWGRIG